MLDARMLPLTAEGVRLRRLGTCDADAYAEGTKDPAVQAYAHLPEQEYTPASVRAMILDTAEEGLRRGDLAVLAIAETTTDGFIGSLVLFDVTSTTGEVGFWLHPRGRGMGAATTALRLARDLCRRSGIPTLTARTIPENAASQRVLLGAGCEETQRQPDTTPAGTQKELIHYRITLGPPRPSGPHGGPGPRGWPSPPETSIATSVWSPGQRSTPSCRPPQA